MLIEFRIQNYRCFKDEVVLSLLSTKDSSLKSNTFSRDDIGLLKSVALYGPNGSGKSTVILALEIVKDLVTTSSSHKPGSALPAAPYLFDESSKEKPCRFEVSFIAGKVTYKYSIEIVKERVIFESLVEMPEKKGRLLFSREYDRKTEQYNWSWGRSLKGEKDRLANMTSQSALFISVAAQFNQEQFNPVYEWFSTNLRIITTKDLPLLVTAQALASEGIEANDKKRVVDFLKDADFEIDDIAVSRQDVPEVEKLFPPGIPDKAKSQLRDRLGGLKVELGHHTPSGKLIRLPLEAESDGTQRLFELAPPWLLSLSAGYVVLVDELDRSLHPLLTRKLVEAFHNPQAKAQLVFSTHDTTLLDPGLFRRDQVYLTDRTPEGSVLYSLSDYKSVRKTESLQKGYLAGRYGAIPILRSFGLHEE